MLSFFIEYIKYLNCVVHVIYSLLTKNTDHSVKMLIMVTDQHQDNSIIYLIKPRFLCRFLQILLLEIQIRTDLICLIFCSILNILCGFFEVQFRIISGRKYLKHISQLVGLWQSHGTIVKYQSAQCWKQQYFIIFY